MGLLRFLIGKDAEDAINMVGERLPTTRATTFDQCSNEIGGCPKRGRTPELKRGEYVSVGGIVVKARSYQK